MNNSPRRPLSPGSVPRPTVPRTSDPAPQKRTPGSVPRPNIPPSGNRAQPRPQSPRPATGAAPANSARATQTRPAHVRPDVQRTDNSADYARRQAAYMRQKAQKEEAERRRKAEKERRRRVAVGRIVVFLIIFAILAAAAILLFILDFNHTDKTSEPSKVHYHYGGTEGASLTDDLALRDGVRYIDFADAAAYLGMTAIGDAKAMRYVIPAPDGAETDSAGNGREEAVVFYAGDTLAEVNGQSVRLDGPAVLYGEHYLVPVSFLTEYMEGVAVTETKDSVSLSRTYTDEVADAVAFTLKNPKPPETLPPAETDTLPPSQPTEADLTVEFQSDLSAYEKYMNPEDRDGYLILVNNHNTLTEDYKPTDLVGLADTRKDGRATQQMREYAAKSLEALYIEMRAAGYTDVSVTSAYRTYTYQNSLFNTYTANEMAKNPALTLAEAQAITATYSARPGTSEHQTGLCCDMHNLSAADQAFAQKEAYTWLCENAWKFGFILRFPEGKEEITEISFEPWHYRYVGRYHAKAMHDTGMCLEEYLEALKA